MKNERVDRILQKWLPSIMSKFSQVAFITILIICYICFAAPIEVYLAVMVLLVIGFTLTCISYANVIKNQCPWELEMISSNCRVASLHSRLSVITNMTLIMISSSFIIMMYMSYIDPDLASHVMYHVTNPKSWMNHHTEFDKISSMVDNWYITNLFKFVMMGILLSKFYECKLLTNILNGRTLIVSHFIIDKDPAETKYIYPLIFIDRKPISKFRYCVSMDDDAIGVLFRPPLSITKNTIIEYKMIEPGIEHSIDNGTLCMDNDKKNCAKRCRDNVRPWQEFNTLLPNDDGDCK